MRKNIPCVCSDPASPTGLLDTAQEVGCHLRLIGSDFHLKENESSWDWWDENQSVEGLPMLPLKGAHQLRNAAGVLELVATMGCSIDTNVVKKSITELQLVGRFQELFARNRKIILDVLAFFLVSSFALTLIVWVIQAVNYLDFVSEDGHSFRVYFMFSVLTIPKIFSKISIFIFFISLFVIISKYEENNEILILWTNGLKKTSFINSILLFSLVVFLFQIILTNFIVPKTQDLARSYIRSSNIDYFPSLIKPKQFIDQNQA